MRIHQPPAGTRDILPLEVAQKRWIADRIQAVFHQWGYQRIITSTLEWVDALTAGGAIHPSTVIQVENTTGGRLGLRPELTASIARAAATRMAGDVFPQRLYYNANVFRRTPGGNHGRQVEFFQTGVELLRAGGTRADSEILLLLVDCLGSLGLEDCSVILGEASLTRSLLNLFPPSDQDRVRACIAHLDRVGLTRLGLSPELEQLALLLFDLRGEPRAVLQKVSHLNLDEQGQQIIHNLKNLIERVEESASTHFSLILDLSLIQTIDYYTGIVFEVVYVQDQQSRVLGKGGRYDQLLGLYHPQGESAPGIGFALNLEEVYSCLLDSEQLPRSAPQIDWLVIPSNDQAEKAAFDYAQKLRQSEHLVRVELELGGRSSDEIRQYARMCNINRLAWIQVDGKPEIELLGNVEN
ncbi:ATP phosphoribosyltransferase regulatory subunit [Spirulina subsalsa]|uniref:ATP phosphoribosyltransferase regulatory subunit n=1 Tax=Spirulina subsalsa TaxID=54311 RepID=UPI0002F48C85|nr:ATP phosphoribosyltransferase regulatory subunit [Spirulina subsalsa]